MINFSSGPAYFPLSLKSRLSQILNTADSPLFLSHLCAVNQEIWQQAKANLRLFDKIPEEFEIILMPLSVRGLFSCFSQNFQTSHKVGVYQTGFWSRYASEVFAKTHFVSPLSPLFDNNNIVRNVDIGFWVSNETISGVKFDLRNKNLLRIVDKSSDYLSEPTDWQSIDCAIIGCQKVFSFPGATLVIARKSFLEQLTFEKVPHNLRYQAYKDSAATTRSNLHSWVICAVTDYLSQRSWSQLQQRRQLWTRKLYHLIDSTPWFYSQVPLQWRSQVNITFSVDKNYKSYIDRFFNRYKALGVQGHKSYQAQYRLSLYPSLIASEHDTQFLDDFSENCSNIIVSSKEKAYF